MIKNITNLTEGELNDQLEYLRDTPVSWIVAAIERGEYVLKKGLIDDVNFLGNQTSIFSNLDGIYANRLYNQEKFLVKHIWEILHREDCNDITSRQKIEEIKRGIAQEWLEPNITFIRDNNDWIADGNKSAAAYYKLKSENSGTIELSVYIATPV